MSLWLLDMICLVWYVFFLMVWFRLVGILGISMLMSYDMENIKCCWKRDRNRVLVKGSEN